MRHNIKRALLWSHMCVIASKGLSSPIALLIPFSMTYDIYYEYISTLTWPMTYMYISAHHL